SGGPSLVRGPIRRAVVGHDHLVNPGDREEGSDRFGHSLLFVVRRDERNNSVTHGGGAEQSTSGLIPSSPPSWNDTSPSLPQTSARPPMEKSRSSTVTIGGVPWAASDRIGPTNWYSVVVDSAAATSALCWSNPSTRGIRKSCIGATAAPVPPPPSTTMTCPFPP